MNIDNITYRSPNFKNRIVMIDTLIIHHTGGLMTGCAEWLCNPESNVSVHYLIDRKGNIYNLVDDNKIAYHCGKSFFDYNMDGKIDDTEQFINNRSIGIELEYYNSNFYTLDQMTSLYELSTYICQKYSIRPSNVLGHKEIAPGRKTDPENFDMYDFRKVIENNIK